MQVNSNSTDFVAGFFSSCLSTLEVWLLLLPIIYFSMEDYGMVTGLLVALCICPSSAGYWQSMRQWIRFMLWYHFYAHLIRYERKSRSIALAPHKVGVQRIKLATEFMVKRAWKAFLAEQVWLLEFPSLQKKKSTAKLYFMKVWG